VNAKTPALPPEPGSESDLSHGLPGVAVPLVEEQQHDIREDLDTREHYSDEDDVDQFTPSESDLGHGRAILDDGLDDPDPEG
jgi:hypothetical protein